MNVRGIAIESLRDQRIDQPDDGCIVLGFEQIRDLRLNHREVYDRSLAALAETKAKEATELGKQKGYPLFFTTEPEE